MSDSERRDEPVLQGSGTAFGIGWTQGVVDASARMVAVVAAEFGPDHPVVERMMVRAANLVGEQYPGADVYMNGDIVETGDDPDDGAP